MDKETFIRLYHETKSINEVARKLGISKATAHRFRQKNNIKLIRYTKYECDEDFFSRNNEESFYWAGFIAADGCVRKEKILKIALANKDIDHLHQFNKAIQSTYPVKRWEHSCELSFCNYKIVKDLKRFNIVARKTHIYTFPEWLKGEEGINHFIRGYIDGDGSFSRYKKQRTFSVRGTKAFLEDLYKIMDKNCGRERERKVFLSNGTHMVSYSGNIIVGEIREFLYQGATIYLERKRSRN